MQGQLVSAHGMLAILEVLEGRGSREVIMRLLQIINLVSTPWGFDFDFDFSPYEYARAVLRADYPCPAYLVAGHSRCKLFGGFLPDWVRRLLSRPANKTDRSYGSGIPVMMGA